MSANREAKKAAHHRFDVWAAATLICIAAALAVMAVARRVMVEEEQRARQASTATWQRYQSSRVRLHLSELALDLLNANPSKATDGAVEKLVADQKRQEQRSQQAQETARKESETADAALRRGFRLRLSLAPLELGLALALVTIFVKRWILLTGAVACALFGLALGLSLGLS